jgi:anti-sigma factor RsiW
MNLHADHPEDRRLWEQYARPGCPDEMELAALFDRRLDPAAVARLKQHVDRCPACAQAVREIEALVVGGPVIAPASVVQRAKSLVASDHAAAHHLSVNRWGMWLSWSAAAMLMIIAGLAGLHSGRMAGVSSATALAAARQQASQPVMTAVRELTGTDSASMEVALFVEGGRR